MFRLLSWSGTKLPGVVTSISKHGPNSSSKTVKYEFDTINCYDSLNTFLSFEVACNLWFHGNVSSQCTPEIVPTLC